MDTAGLRHTLNLMGRGRTFSGMDEWRARCARCGQAFDEAENWDGACLYHPGRLCDYNTLNDVAIGAAGDFWDCCMRHVDRDPGSPYPDGVSEALAILGCARGRHVEAEPDDPGPVRREIEEDRRLHRQVMYRLVGTSSHPSRRVILQEIDDSLSRRSALESRLLRTLGCLDAGRALAAVHRVADRVRRLRESLTQASVDAPARTVTELVAACEDYARDYGAESLTAGALPHVRWQHVREESAIAGRCRFGSTGSLKAFDELLHYLAGACHGLARVHSVSREVIAELSEADASFKGHGREIAALVSREADECRRIGRILDETSAIVCDVLAETDDFGLRRRLLAERVQSEHRGAVAHLLKAIGNAPGP